MITTTVHSSRNRPRGGGFTLVETMVGVAVGGMLLAGLTSGFLFLTKGTIGLGNYAEMNRVSRLGLEQFGRDVRMATEVANLQGDSFDLRVSSPAGTEWVTYYLDADTGRLLRSDDAGERRILSDVDALEFLYFTLRGDPTTHPGEVKKVQVDARLLRTVLQIENSNHVISARYMMRNREVAN